MTDPATRDCATDLCSLDRRSVLVAAGLAATAVTAAACGSDRSDVEAAPPEEIPVGPGPMTAPTVSTAPELPAGALATVAEVPKGGGVVVDGGKVLVVQLSGGVFKAFDARCTHKGVPVDPPTAEGTVVCPRHKATFKASDGSVLKGPAERALSGIPVKVDGEYVVRA